MLPKAFNILVSNSTHGFFDVGRYRTLTSLSDAALPASLTPWVYRLLFDDMAITPHEGCYSPLAVKWHRQLRSCEAYIPGFMHYTTIQPGILPRITEIIGAADLNCRHFTSSGINE